MPHSLRLLQAVHVVVAEPDGAYLALLFELEHRPPVVLDAGTVVGRPVHLEQVQDIDLKPAQRCLRSGPDAVWRAHPERGLVTIAVVPYQAAFGEDVRPVGEGYALHGGGDHLFGVPEAVYSGGVDPVDPALHGVADGRYRLLIVLRPPGEGPTSATGCPRPEADAGDLHPGFTQRAGR